MDNSKKKPRSVAAGRSGALKKKQSRTLPDLETVDDPELRRWAEEMRRRRNELADVKKRRFIVSHYEVDGEKHRVGRNQSEPLPIAKFIKPARRKNPVQGVEDIKLIRQAWERAVGLEIASESRVYAFKRGVLTIEVFASSLLQEIRQFHGHAIFSVLSDIWNLPQPLIKVIYRLGKK